MLAWFYNPHSLPGDLRSNLQGATYIMRLADTQANKAQLVPGSAQAPGCAGCTPPLHTASHTPERSGKIGLGSRSKPRYGFVKIFLRSSPQLNDHTRSKSGCCEAFCFVQNDLDTGR